LFGDEATFRSNGYLNKHNCHYWSTSESSLVDFTSIVGSFMFGKYAMVKSSDLIFLNIPSPVQLIYSSFRTICQNILRTLSIHQRCWFQQDSAPAHFYHVRTFLGEQYPNHYRSRKTVAFKIIKFKFAFLLIRKILFMRRMHQPPD